MDILYGLNERIVEMDRNGNELTIELGISRIPKPP
jgi:hypothetical protein